MCIWFHNHLKIFWYGMLTKTRGILCPYPFWVISWAAILVANRIISELTKGQLILKCLFGIFNSPKKRTEKFNCTTMVPQVELSSFIFWENWRHFEINWIEKCKWTRKWKGKSVDETPHWVLWQGLDGVLQSLILLKNKRRFFWCGVLFSKISILPKISSKLVYIKRYHFWFCLKDQ